MTNSNSKLTAKRIKELLIIKCESYGDMEQILLEHSVFDTKLPTEEFMQYLKDDEHEGDLNEILLCQRKIEYVQSVLDGEIVDDWDIKSLDPVEFAGWDIYDEFNLDPIPLVWELIEEYNVELAKQLEMTNNDAPFFYLEDKAGIGYKLTLCNDGHELACDKAGMGYKKTFPSGYEFICDKDQVKCGDWYTIHKCYKF